jgi:hypothetical protein
MNDRQKLALNEPAIYQIQIQGTLDENWGDYFGGQIIYSTDQAVTTLHTPLMDQPALVGLVGRLNGLGLRLLSVKQMPVEKNQNEESST